MTAGSASDTIEALARELVAEAASRKVRIAVAESLTGGLLAASIVSVPGASRVFAGGVVAYDTALKHTLLGVDADLLRHRGPVDERVAQDMAHGVRAMCAVPGARRDLESVDLGIATTGVAGPGPDPQTGQPAGTVWVGVSHGAGPDSALAVPGLAGFDRQAIREHAVAAALAAAVHACVTQS